MVIAVPLMRMMQMAFHQVVDVLAVWNSFVSTARLMRMFPIVRTARMARGAVRRIRAAIWQGMFIQMSRMDTVKMPIV